MRFFEYQRQAKQLSRRLLWLYCAAVLAVVGLTTVFLVWLLPWSKTTAANAWWWQTSPEFWIWTALIVLAVVLGGTLVKLHTLSRGGRVVAEEMAIAAGLPMPKVYLIEEEDINAFAAGLQPNDAVIAVTRGALTTLSRDELQAVVGHEFSHILNGDMNLNMYLTGLLYGLEMIGLIGRWLLFGNNNRGDSGNNEIDDVRNAMRRTGNLINWLGLLGLGLMLLGFIGTVLAGWIRAAVSRQREFLADASSVQFTRQKEGLLGALMKMTEAPHRMLNNRRATQEYAHFFFGSVHENWLTRLAATHPPVVDRMARLDAQRTRQWVRKHTDILQKLARGGKRHHDMTAGFGTTAAAAQPAQTPYWLQPVNTKMAAEPSSADITPDQQVLAEVKYLNPAHIRYAVLLRHQLPEAWYQASQDSEKASALMCILLLSDEASACSAQQALIAGYSRALSLRVQALQQKMPRLAREQVLPLLDLMLPALAGLPEKEQKSLRQLWQRLITADNRLDLHEWCVWTVLNAHLYDNRDNHHPIPLRQNAAADVGVVLAYSAHINNSADATANYHAVATTLNDMTLPDWKNVSSVSLMDLQASMRRLAHLDDAGKARVLQAILSAIQADGRIDVTEREWMRALTAAWHYPMPPLLPQNRHTVPVPQT